MKRIISTILLCSMLLSTFACSGTDDGGTKDGGDTTAAETDAETVYVDPRETIDDGLGNVTFDGATFTMLGRESKVDEYSVEEETGDVVDDAAYKRDMVVEERFKVDVELYAMDGSWGNMAGFKNTLAQVGMSGDGTYALVEGDIVIADLIGNNYFIDWNQFDFVDFSKPWWAEALNSAIDIGGKIEFVTGDYSLTLYKGLVCMFYNKKIAEEKQVEDIYQLVRDKKWTIDKLMNLSTEISEDLNGDSAYDENDMYGLLYLNGNMTDNFIISSDVRVIEEDADGNPIYNLTSERALTMAEKVFNLSQATGVYCPEESEGETLKNMFMNNQGLFYTTLLDSAVVFRDMETDFGIIPYPLFDENQEEYKTFSKAGFAGFAIPQTAADPEMSATITTALMAESYKKVVPAYYDVTLKTKASRDDESEEMLDIIRQGFDCDLGTILGDNTAGAFYLLRHVVSSKSFKFASQVASNEKACMKQLQKLYDNILANQ
ncbi:MAG: hypothetical protein J6I45_12580 [Clostridia bacterium]|nr:hypothetical protein [Clostridia bacterium]